ncbi:threonine aspartase 1-like [Brachionus plicatilis]|uniref:Threonine aspartase 1-like n=1 Tax=Brachionus plicatilis TaxID=10195 RepID=A0A3M7SID6_BRAPC|nr:threonine aspartase 1-like [Brachionus plicatilis]
MFGCGCWVEQDIKTSDEEVNSIGICTTGCGEYIIKSLFAKECAQNILRNLNKTDYDLNQFFKKYFFDAPLLKKFDDKLIGALICKLSSYQNNEKNLELIVAHTTPSMCFGYVSSNMIKPTSVMSRMSENNLSIRECVQITNFNIKFRSKLDQISQNEVNHEEETSNKRQKI